jgi:serine/threonine protein phosphatase PrpC
VSATAHSEQGTVRAENQDCVAVHSLDAGEGMLLALADGMGGHPDGRLAATLAVEASAEAALHACATGTPPDGALRLAMAAADAAVAAHRVPDERGRTLGTTLVLALVRGDAATVASAGDSRAYHLRDGVALQVTADHSWVAEAVRDGRLHPAEAASHPRRHVVTRAIMGVSVTPDIFVLSLQAGDHLLLCSDGLWEPLGDERIAALVREHAAAPVEAAARSLCQAALDAGSRDNASAALLRCGGG